MSAGDSHIDKAHILLGLLKEKQGLVSKLLARFGVFCEDVRRKFFEKSLKRQCRCLKKPFLPTAKNSLDSVCAPASIQHS
ncbi:MAG: Clp protease N-terminal domain-containing protein [Armatimonadota bacterium]|nr:Clp protease N-terminal domain-containing protein [Armatimonadota bacterium]MDW8142454.1 Clp protease N-terminal domain-containing protein [Armatimonadota bacterium]